MHDILTCMNSSMKCIAKGLSIDFQKHFSAQMRSEIFEMTIIKQGNGESIKQMIWLTQVNGQGMRYKELQ